MIGVALCALAEYRTLVGSVPDVDVDVEIEGSRFGLAAMVQFAATATLAIAWEATG